MQAPSTPLAQAFFLDTADGRRFCLFHAANENIKCRGAILVVPPFGEEMNKSRKMIALQARSLAQHGFSVLIMDLYGCGDSEGELRDASWVRWKNDLGAAHAWLHRKLSVPISLLSLRLGGLLALDFIQDEIYAIKRLVLWQPILNGQQYLTQFFRLRLANDMLTGNVEQSSGTRGIRQALNNGEVVEIAGYEMSSKITMPIDTLNGSDFLPRNLLIDWIEIQNGNIDSPSFARRDLMDYWQQHHINVRFSKIDGPEFWTTQEITECPKLMDFTLSVFEQDQA